MGARRTEEASVAGESPDRSKQQGSSAETTSGSGAPVPGPAKAGRDPRLALTGEKVRVDQATTVLSTKSLRGSAATAVEEVDQTEEGTGPADTADSGADAADSEVRERAALASWVRSAEEDEAEERAEAEPEEGPEGESGEESPAEPEAESEEKAEAESEEESPGEPEDGSSGADASEAEPEAEDASEAGDDADADAEAGDDADADAEVGADADADAADAESAISEAESESEDSPKSEEKQAEQARQENQQGDEKAEEKGKEGEEEESEGERDSDSDDKKDPEPPVDQPTAVFKAVRPPAVDQPTTMLKVGDAKPSAKSGPSWADKSDKPESEAERTSRFVPLKSLDEPRPTPAEGPQAKPPQAKPTRPASTESKPAAGPADATTAMPQVGPERTAQQPIPPKPPLDLLAELTNTPPPPETPVRTVLRRIKIWSPLVVLLVVIFAIVQAVRPLPTPTLALTADATYTFKGGKLDLPWPGQGQSAIEVEGVGMIGTEGQQSPKPIASVAKIMTAYVTLQAHPLKGNQGGPTITVDQQAEDDSKKEDESTAAMKKGQKFSERQMLQMLMIPSGNNVARLLARWDSDNDTFVGKMNAAAKKLGMTHTTYTDPSGLDKTTVSTAVDQLKLAEAVMQNEVFRSIVGMAKADIPGLDKPIYNNNDLLVKQVGVIGLKTGSSTPAGGNLVWAATKVVDGRTRTIYGAVLNQDAHTGRVWDSLQLALTNSQKLINTIQQSLTTATVVKKGDVVGYLDDQLGGRAPVVATQTLTAVGWPGLKTRLSIGDDGTAPPHEAKAGKVVGELTVGDGSSHAVKVPVALQKDLAEPGFTDKLTRLG
ncbi:serine hydrolase [Streptomyces cynarae]|uniref:Serine hydrolase n=1 Tax=Streptomyces cynarae TaxID=2981134 RepID=A0ABY6E3M8_9ACTN|nr:serine hydrolase [Streptomyces cynarae]UXY20426.1 serine hydrolase [Streptomyces cynarae]